MLKLLEQYTNQSGGTVELFQTRHSGPDFHVRYGLQVNAFDTLTDAQSDFRYCVVHLQQCEDES